MENFLAEWPNLFVLPTPIPGSLKGLAWHCFLSNGSSVPGCSPYPSEVASLQNSLNEPCLAVYTPVCTALPHCDSLYPWNVVEVMRQF